MCDDTTDRRDAGLGLTELIVVMMVTMVVLAAVSGLFVNLSRAVAAGRTTAMAAGSVANAVDEMGRVVRVGSAVATSSGLVPAVSAGSAAGSLVVIAYTDVLPNAPAPSRVSFTLNAAGNLVESRTAGVRSSTTGYWSFTGVTTVRTLPGPFASTSPSFVYRDAAGGVVTSGSGGLTATQAASVAQVVVTVTSRRSGLQGADPVTMTTTALVPGFDAS